MPITQTNQVDYLLKKIGYGVSKTDTSTAKSPTNESIPSPLTIRGDTIWVQSDLIPALQPATSSGVVAVYRDTNSNTVKTVNDNTSTAYRTWKTNISRWIDPSFGSTYAVKVYWDTTTASSPQTTGTQLFPDGSGNNDYWFFDYGSGILTFPDTIPTAVNNVTGKTIYIVGASYSGLAGLANATAVLGGSVDSANLSYHASVSLNSTDATFYPALFSNTSGNLSYYTASTIAFNPAAGNLTVGNVAASAYFYANGMNALSGLGNVNTASYLPVYNGNILAGNITVTNNVVVNGTVSASNYTATGNVTLTPSNAGVIVMASGTAVQVPVGNTIQRPSGTAGYVRFNSDTSTLEYYDGIKWLATINTISEQPLSGDGITKTFVLNQTTTAIGVLVSINGTLQQPNSAYSVNGNEITFAEAPLANDLIDVRFLVATTVATVDTMIVDTGNVTVGTSLVNLDSWNMSSYRSAKYTISSNNGTDSQMSDVYLIHNGLNGFISNVTLLTGSNRINFTASTSAGNVVLQAVSTIANNQVRIQRTYFNI
jgi:hypothetical protein